MASIAVGSLTANGSVNIAPPQGDRTAFPGTVAVWGTVGSIQINAGFYDASRTLQFVSVGSPLTAPGAVNISVRCDILQLVLTGAGPAGYWVG